jgi:hypothetical protein
MELQVEKCIPVDYIYFLKASFIIFHISLAFIFIYFNKDHVYQTYAHMWHHNQYQQ